MTIQLKKRTLESVISSVEAPMQHASKLKRKSIILTASSYVLIFLVFVLYFQGFKGLYLPVIAAFSGVTFGLSLYLDSARKQWEYLVPHINVESVKEALIDYET